MRKRAIGLGGRGGSQAFEWGTLEPTCPGAIDGYTHIFMTTFENAAGRDAYLAHPEHERFAAVIRAGLERVIIMDFWLDA